MTLHFRVSCARIKPEDTNTPNNVTTPYSYSLSFVSLNATDIILPQEATAI
jgi:hypothetical protein